MSLNQYSHLDSPHELMVCPYCARRKGSTTPKSLRMKASCSATKNGTDYVTVNFKESGKRIGGFNASIFTVKKLAANGFLGALGEKAVNEYIDCQTIAKILKDSQDREDRKKKESGESKADILKG